MSTDKTSDPDSFPYSAAELNDAVSRGNEGRLIVVVNSIKLWLQTSRRDELADRALRAVPEGGMMVPREPTKAMLFAGLRAEVHRIDGVRKIPLDAHTELERRYDAMLAAAPVDSGIRSPLPQQQPDGSKPADGWQPIETAPKDGRPVWVKGFNWGDAAGNRGVHQCWAWFTGTCWRGADTEDVELEHLREWMPLPAAPKEPT